MATWLSRSHAAIMRSRSRRLASRYEEVPLEVSIAGAEISNPGFSGITRLGRLGQVRVGATIEDVGQLSGVWCFPDRPLVRILLDNEPLASADYLEASASTHWFVRWEDHEQASPQGEIALPTLAGQVPEDAARDESFELAVLEAALSAVASQLTHRAAGLHFEKL